MTTILATGTALGFGLFLLVINYALEPMTKRRRRRSR